MSASVDALQIDKSIRRTFCGTRHLSWLLTGKNGVLFIKQNRCRLFYRVGMSLRNSIISWNMKRVLIKGGNGEVLRVARPNIQTNISVTLRCGVGNLKDGNVA